MVAELLVAARVDVFILGFGAGRGRSAKSSPSLSVRSIAPRALKVNRLCRPDAVEAAFFARYDSRVDDAFRLSFLLLTTMVSPSETDSVRSIEATTFPGRCRPIVSKCRLWQWSHPQDLVAGFSLVTPIARISNNSPNDPRGVAQWPGFG